MSDSTPIHIQRRPECLFCGRSTSDRKAAAETLRPSLLYWDDAEQAEIWTMPPGEFASDYAKGQIDDPLEETYNISSYTVGRIAELAICGLLDWLEKP